MYKIFQGVMLVAGLLFTGIVCSADLEKRYELPGHGELVLKVPGEWNDKVARPYANLPPTIQFVQGSGDPFVILLTPMWKMPGASPDFATPEGMKKLVQNAITQVSPQAVEKTIEIQEMKGVNTGYYFSVTDKAPKPGEYKYMTQGIITINELLATFTILTNDAEFRVANQALKIFGAMRHLQ